ncbi:MAG: hypothetical protein N2689_17320, partial [Verrucomicrobiae bacterium]|nr:hypothetical protein [Verrucomicrobiae bacterium]
MNIHLILNPLQLLFELPNPLRRACGLAGRANLFELGAQLSHVARAEVCAAAFKGVRGLPQRAGIARRHRRARGFQPLWCVLFVGVEKALQK